MPKQIQKSYTSTSQKVRFSSKRIQSEPCHNCSHLKTAPVTAGGKEKRNDAVKFPDTVRFLFENFKSLYRENFQNEQGKTKNERTESEAPKTLAKPPVFFSGEDYSAAAAEETDETEADDSTASGDFIAILKYSPSPFREFRRSMAEMAQARLERGDKVDWDFLEELLFRYLDLNNERAQRDIMRAFVDLVVFLHETIGSSGAAPAVERRRWWEVAGRGR